MLCSTQEAEESPKVWYGVRDTIEQQTVWPHEQPDLRMDQLTRGWHRWRYIQRGVCERYGVQAIDRSRSHVPLHLNNHVDIRASTFHKDRLIEETAFAKFKTNVKDASNTATIEIDEPGIRTGAARALWIETEHDAASKQAYVLYHNAVTKAIQKYTDDTNAMDAFSVDKKVADICKLDPKKDFLDWGIERKMREHMKPKGVTPKYLKSVNRFRSDFEFDHNTFSGPLQSGADPKIIKDQISSPIEPATPETSHGVPQHGSSPAGVGAQNHGKNGKGTGKSKNQNGKGPKGKGKGKNPKGRGNGNKDTNIWQEAFVKGKIVQRMARARMARGKARTKRTAIERESRTQRRQAEKRQEWRQPMEPAALAIRKQAVSFLLQILAPLRRGNLINAIKASQGGEACIIYRRRRHAAQQELYHGQSFGY